MLEQEEEEKKAEHWLLGGGESTDSEVGLGPSLASDSHENPESHGVFLRYQSGICYQGTVMGDNQTASVCSPAEPHGSTHQLRPGRASAAGPQNRRKLPRTV